MSTLESIAAGIVDCEHKTSPVGDGYAYAVGTKAMKGGKIVLDQCRPVSADTYAKWSRRAIPEPGDLVLAREAPVGEVVRLPESPRFCLGQRTVLIKPDHDRVDGRFLHYWLQGPSAQHAMTSIASGATTPHLNVGDIRKLPIELMPTNIGVQRVIGSVLGSIDDLIENNRRRIEVLEEMAQAIYREWFVHFRYPGHEDATFVGSPLGPIPDGWTVNHLADVATLVRGRSYRKHELSEDDGLPFVNLKCMMRGGGFRVDGLKRYTGIYKPEQIVEHGDIVLAVTDLTQGREILAQATLIPRLDEERGVISLDVARILPLEDRERLPLYFALRCTDFADRVKEFANGSTVLHLSPKHVETNALVWPEQSLRQRFAELATPMIVGLDDLRQSADRLAAMRDLLLPKLVTGEIDVSKLDLDALVEAT